MASRQRRRRARLFVPVFFIIFDRFRAVSYTHLDVYKRQPCNEERTEEKMKLKHIAIIGSLFPILFSLVLFFGVLISADSDDENSNFSSGITGMNLSAEVLKHQPMVEKYARENGISEYVNVLLAIIQVERCV